MSEEQSTELAASAPEAPVESTPAASEVQPEAPKQTVTNEPRHPLQDILDKAVAKKQATEPTQAPKEEALAQKAAETFDLSKWDGNVLTLPDKVKKIVTDNQAAFHAKSKEAAELKQQYEALNQQVQQYMAQVQQAQQKPLFTQQEFEAAQLDPNKFLELTQRVAKNIVDAEKAQIAPVLSQLEFNQKVVENERMINDFSTQHKDFWHLYDAGILEPLVKAHGLEDGYAKAVEIASKFEQKAVADAQARVQQKKGSISAKPTTSQSIETVFKGTADERLREAMRLASEGKHVKVRRPI